MPASPEHQPRDGRTHWWPKAARWEAPLAVWIPAWMRDDVGTSKKFKKKSAESNEHVEDVEHMEQDLGNSPGRVPNFESIIRIT